MMSLKTHRANIVGACFFLVIGIVTFAQMATLIEQGDSSDPGAAGYPNLIGGAMIVLAVMLAFQRDNGGPLPTGGEILRVLAAIAATFAYIAVMQPLGYVLSTVLFLFVTMLLMGIRSVVALIVAPVGLTLINFYLFYVGFGVPLPYTFIERFLT